MEIAKFVYPNFVLIMLSGLLWCYENDEMDNEDEAFSDNTSEQNDSVRDTTIGDKLKEFMEELEESLR